MTVKRETLTPRQKDILSFVSSYAKENDVIPSYREIAAACGLKSIATVAGHVEALVSKKLLSRDPGKYRGLSLAASIASEAPSVALPVVGCIAAGEPFEALDDEYASPKIAVPREMVPHANCYVLKVKGQSMKDDGILDGDYVVVERNFYPRDGQVVVAVLPDNTATLKRLYKEKGGYRLQPANAAFKPLRVRSVAVQGVVCAVLRYFMPA